MTGYHITLRKNVGAIHRWGLIPRDTAEHNYAGDGGASKNFGVEAVYVFTDRDDAEQWIGFWDVPGEIILEIDLSGYELERDTVATGESAHRVRHRIPPERILGKVTA